MKALEKIAQAVACKKTIGTLEHMILSLTFDSRSATEGSLYFAIVGIQTDGHNYINTAIESGAKAIVCQKTPKKINTDVCYLIVENSNLALAQASDAFYNSPSKKLKLVGVTGTNGKTTTATLLHQLFTELGYKVGLLSTVKYIVGEKTVHATHTTPDPIRTNAMLVEMAEANCEFCFMEVSSHAVVQHRTSALTFAGGIFTNITHDHLDYHKTFRAYIDAKKGFFDLLPSQAFALVNADDKNGSVMLQNTKAKKQSFGLKNMATYKAAILEHDFNGMQLILDGQEFWSALVGEFNAYNLLGVYSTAILLGQNKLSVLTALSKLQHVDGRFELLHAPNGISAIVDYAHTPDALTNVLRTINVVKNDNQRLITVVGAGGDRDKSKRPEMAKVAALNSTKLVLTSDNPRTENPECILDEMQAGVPTEENAKVLRITNRKEAIRTAIHLASSGDIILVAGKGHENYQEINGVRHHFDDKEVINELFNQLA